MTDHDPDQGDVLKELDAALQVEPSRAFADGVRARVTRAHTRNRNMWWGLAAAASVGLATVSLWRPSVVTPAAVPVASNQAAVTTQPVSDRTPAATPEGVVARGETAPPAVRRVAPVVSVSANATSEPRLEVITNQAAVLRELWAAHQGRPLVIADGEQVVDGLATKPITVDPIVVAPIVVSEIGKEPGSAGATPIIRRAYATRETR